METIFIDTHIAVWIYYGYAQELSLVAANAIEKYQLLISPISILELDYLHEIKKISHSGSVVMADLSSRIDLKIADDSFIEIIKEASKLSWTRDVFDRLIVAHATQCGSPLITKDRLIRKHYKCIW